MGLAKYGELKLKRHAKRTYCHCYTCYKQSKEYQMELFRQQIRKLMTEAYGFNYDYMYYINWEQLGQKLKNVCNIED